MSLYSCNVISDFCGTIFFNFYENMPLHRKHTNFQALQLYSRAIFNSIQCVLPGFSDENIIERWIGDIKFLKDVLN
jgi:hypothetical protein